MYQTLTETKSIKQCYKDMLSLQNYFDNKRNEKLRECITLLDQNAEELTNNDIEEVRKVLWEVVG